MPFYRILRGTVVRRESTGKKDERGREQTEAVFYGNQPGQRPIVEFTEEESARRFGIKNLERVSDDRAKAMTVERSDPTKGISEQGDGNEYAELSAEEQSALEEQKAKVESQRKTADQAAATVKPEGAKTQPAPDFDSFTVSELREYAEANSIDLTGKVSKADILAEVKRRSRK